MTRKYSIAEARDQFASLIHQVEQEAAIELTRRGKPVAVILSMPHYRQLQAEKTGFWSAYSAYRDRFDLSALDIQPEIFTDQRDRTPGREVVL
jgi:prevent-host-death family protein